MSDTIKAACGSCGAKLKLKPKYAGRKVQCPRCKKAVQVPEEKVADESAFGDAMTVTGEFDFPAMDEPYQPQMPKRRKKKKRKAKQEEKAEPKPEPKKERQPLPEWVAQAAIGGVALVVIIVVGVYIATGGATDLWATKSNQPLDRSGQAAPSDTSNESSNRSESGTAESPDFTDVQHPENTSLPPTDTSTSALPTVSDSSQLPMTGGPPAGQNTSPATGVTSPASGTPAASNPRPTNMPTALDYQLRNLKGEITKDEDGQIVSVEFVRSPITDQQLGVLKTLPKLQLLRLGSCNNLTNDGFNTVGELVTLKTLWIHTNKGVSGSAFQFVEDLPELEVLNVHVKIGLNKLFESIGRMKPLKSLRMSDFGIRDEYLVHLAGQTELTELRLGRSYVTDKGIPHLLGMSNLEVLSLASADITNDGVRQISASCPNLRQLILHSCEDVSDDALIDLAQLKHLETLDLSSCRISDRGVANLIPCTSLTSVNLHGCSRISDAGLQSLARLPNLTSLFLEPETTDALTRRVNRPAYSEAGLEAFRKAAPQCGIKFELQ